MFLLAACGDDTSSLTDGADAPTENSDSTDNADPTETTNTAMVCTTDGAEEGAGADVTGRTKPEVEVPAAPATELECTDLIVGTGAEVTDGATVEVHYVGVSQSTGQQFDASWDRGETIEFGLGQVIQGWGEGLVGMKEGGRRVLVIPADKGYGATGQPQAGIAPGETLVFVVDMVSTT